MSTPIHSPQPLAAAPAVVTTPKPRRLSLRTPIPMWQATLLALACLATVFAAWTFVTWGETGEERIVGSTTLPSPSETFSQLHNLYFEFELTRNIAVTLKRVTLGFLLALVVGVPLG